MPNPVSSPLGIYVSIPFCRAKCSYCNFASGVFGAERMSAYVDHLEKEIRDARRRTRNQGALLAREADSIYFGGGTPSTLEDNQVQNLIKVLHDRFIFPAEVEFTLECAPGQLRASLLDSFRKLGINRVSLGVQSFVDREAAVVGRTHTRSIVMEEIARLRDAGIEEINVDLIAGLPHQTLDSWRTSLDVAIESGVPHLSVYMLDVDDDSRLGREMLAGGTRYGAGRVPEDLTIAAMYEEACERFAAAGIPQYEISNFARPGHESRHNLKYWTRQPYIGFGLDAHSFLPVPGGRSVRIATADDLTSYMDGTATESLTAVSEIEAMEEAWFLGLRLSCGVSLSAMEQEFGQGALDQFEAVWRGCEQEGWIERVADRVRLTLRGRLFANDVFVRFLGVTDRKTGDERDDSHPRRVRPFAVGRSGAGEAQQVETLMSAEAMPEKENRL